jgi:aryl-alcohol dehydrogenase-like predicted oxidoreductase
MISRREWLRVTVGAGAAAALSRCTSGVPQSRGAAPGQELLTRPIPSTGERLPVIGLGGANTFSEAAREEEFDTIGEVLQALLEGGATVFDTAAGYGASEEVAGRVAQELGIADRIFWATKVNVAGGFRGGPREADPDAVRAQIERSFERLRVPVIDLIQVHNMGDPPTQLRVLREYKAEGRIRYVGITTTSERQYDALAEVMRGEPLDFIGIDYAVDNRVAEKVIFPLAQGRGIATLIYLPFGRSRLWQRIGDRPVPDWAADFGARTWAQFMLKFVVANPAVTVATPGTRNPAHMTDNIGGGVGRLPNADELRRMIELVDSLPAA